MLWFSLVASIILVFVAYGFARSSLGMTGACIAAVLGGFFGIPCAMFPALILTGLGTALWGCVSRMRRVSSAGFLKGSLVVMLASHVVVGALSIREQVELRTNYPVESMSNALAYETKAAHAGRSREAPLNGPGKTLASSARSDWNRLEEELSFHGSRRSFLLSLLHDDAVKDFIDSPGFGISRMPVPTKREIELPEPEPISLPAPTPHWTYDPKSGDFTASSSAQDPTGPSATSPNESALRNMHLEGVVDFLNPDGFGFVLDREHVRGFQPHQFRSMPKLEEEGRPRKWRIESLQLVSLLKFDEPAVYLSSNLPRMQDLREAKTRPLDSFEKTGLAALQNGKNLKVQSYADQIRMLGSIRAIKKCLGCHDVEPGHLLGAFSYTLTRDEGQQ